MFLHTALELCTLLYRFASAECIFYALPVRIRTIKGFVHVKNTFNYNTCKQGSSLRSPPAAPVPYEYSLMYSHTDCMHYHVSTAVKGQTLLLRRGHSKGEFWGHWWTCKLHPHDALYSIVAHAHLQHPVQACDLINQLANKLVSSLDRHLFNSVCKAKKQRTKSTTYMMMTATIPSLESSVLAICSPLHVSVHCCLFFVQSVQEASTFTYG